MSLLRRKTDPDAKAAALARAREATASARREKRRLERFKSKKQSNPIRWMTPNQWIGRGGG